MSILPWKSLIISCGILFAQESDRGIKRYNSSIRKRIALIIGNSDYMFGGKLENPVNDAIAMEYALEKSGFEAIKYENCVQKTMKKAIDDFGNSLKNHDVGLFFYAGHGVQVNGRNYLIPIDAKLDNENDVEYDCVRADRILAKMENAKTKVNIVILDACRDNPFERSWHRGTKGNGLAFMDAPGGSLIAYATSPGKTASDGKGNNGLYTSGILEHIGTPNITIEEMFKRVRATVTAKSGNKQIPWEATSLKGNFYFNNIENYKPTDTSIEIEVPKITKSGEWYVILGSFPKVQVKQAEDRVTLLKHYGYESYIIDTDNFSKLTNGLWAVVMGPYSKSHASKVKIDLQQFVTDAYIKIAE